MRKKKALAELAFHAQQHCVLFKGFHSFGDDNHVQTIGQGYNGFNDVAVSIGDVLYSRYEAAVHLEGVDR